MSDFEIAWGSPLAKALGFTSDKFDGYLWKSGNYIVISFIISLQEEKGNLSNLFNKIESSGYGIKVPTPFARMEAICIAKGFKRTEEWFKEADCSVEVWVKDPKTE